VLYRDDTPSATAWRRTELVRTPSTCLWTGGGVATGTRIEYLVQALDDAGNVGVSSFKARYYEALPQPAEPPGFDVELGGTRGDDGWFTTAVEIALSTTGGSAIEYALDGGPLRRYEAPFTIGSTGVHVVDYSTANGILGREVVPVDVTAPRVEFDEPAEDAAFDLGEVARARYTCADAGSGLRSCVGTPASGALLETGTVGEKTVTVTAVDRAGHSTTAVRHYRVEWPFRGFFAPVAARPAVNDAKAGSTVPVKFSLGGNRGLDVLAAGYPRSQSIACGTNPNTEGQEPTASPGGSRLTFDDGVYQLNWKTEKSWRGCRQLVVKLRDGSYHRANFRFR
jgi:hypothetical protein